MVREEEGPDPGYIAAIPTTAERGMTSLQWINDKKAVETAAVRYVRTPKAGLRLKEELPTNWKPGEYRAFSVRNIPYSILVSQDPTLRPPFKPPSIADLIRPRGRTTPEEPGPELAMAVLMFEVVRADDHLDVREREALARQLAERFSLGDEELASLLTQAEQDADHGEDADAYGSGVEPDPRFAGPEPVAEAAVLLLLHGSSYRLPYRVRRRWRTTSATVLNRNVSMNSTIAARNRMR